MGRGKTAGTYAIYDRLKYLENQDHLILQKYMALWEISRRTALRDLDHIRTFYDIDFIYNVNTKVYVRG